MLGLDVSGLRRDLASPELSAAAIASLSAYADGVARAAQEELGRQWVSVRDAGALGDGTSDDVAAINAAIARLSPGQTLHFPPGTYLVSNADVQGSVTTRPLPVGANVLMAAGAWLKRHPRETNGIQGFFTCSGDNVLQVNIDGDEYPGSMTGAWAAAQSYGVYAPSSAAARGVVIFNSRFKNLTRGVFGIGVTAWRVIFSHFHQIRLSGVQLGAAGAAPCTHNLVVGNDFERMGDTAVAFYQTAIGGFGEIAHNIVAINSARNTQYLTNGFAIDFENGYQWGTQSDNIVAANSVLQEEASAYFQGGIHMGAFSETGLIAGNNLKGNLNTTNDVGINIPQSRAMLVVLNQIEGFRGNAVNADGAASPTIRATRIRNCGSAGSALRSAIVLSSLYGSADATVDDVDIAWDADYAYGGGSAAAVFARKYGVNNVRNLIVRAVRIRNPIDFGLYIHGYAGELLEGVTIEDVEMTGAEGPGLFTAAPIFASYVDRLQIRNVRVSEAKAGFDLTGSTHVAFQRNTLANRAAAPALPYLINVAGVTYAEIDDNAFSANAAAGLVPLSQLAIAGHHNVARNNRGLAAGPAGGAGA